MKEKKVIKIQISNFHSNRKEIHCVFDRQRKKNSFRSTFQFQFREFFRSTNKDTF